jgi:hypothetical protein
MNIAPCGSWKSPITSDLIVAQSIALSEIRLDGGEPYWLERRPHEAGRSVVVSGRDLLPPPFNVRTRAHEYGGGAWTVADGALYFSNDKDQRLYLLQRGAAEPEPLTPEGPFRYADGVIDARRRLWIGVREDHSAAGHEPANTLVAVDLSQPNHGRVLAEGHDFFSSPKLSPDGAWLAYLAWDHPRMPWVGTTLYAMPLDAAGTPAGDAIAIAGGADESIFQPEWSPDGAGLFFVSDRTGWWNLYRSAWPSRNIAAVLPMDAEFGQPQWVFGMSTYAFAGAGRLVCSYASKGLGRLGAIDLAAGKLTPHRSSLFGVFLGARGRGPSGVSRRIAIYTGEFRPSGSRLQAKPRS